MFFSAFIVCLSFYQRTNKMTLGKIMFKYNHYLKYSRLMEEVVLHSG